MRGRMSEAATADTVTHGIVVLLYNMSYYLRHTLYNNNSGGNVDSKYDLC